MLDYLVYNYRSILLLFVVIHNKQRNWREGFIYEKIDCNVAWSKYDGNNIHTCVCGRC